MSGHRTPQTTRALSGSSWHADSSHRSITPTAPPIADPQDMLQLMRKTRGRMQGNVSFRDILSHSKDWINSYCYTDPESGALLFEISGAASDDAFATLIPDLRGAKIRTVHEPSLGASVMEVLYRSDDEEDIVLHLRPERPNYFNSWYAALLCWSVCLPGQPLVDSESKAKSFLRPNVRYEQPHSHPRTNAPIRTERALLLVEGSPDFSNIEYPSNTTATEVFCTVRGTGELSIHGLKSRRTLATIQLRLLPRSAIQRLHKSVFGLSRTIGIYPQYAHDQNACSSMRPVYLSLNYTDSYEMLLVLLKAFTLPELHCLSQPITQTANASKDTSSEAAARPNGSSIFRIEHFIYARIERARFITDTGAHESRVEASMDFYVELLIDEQIKAKSSVKTLNKSDLFWAEGFDLVDLPSVLSSLAFRLKKRHVQQSGEADISDTASIMTSKTGMYVKSMHSAFDTVHAVVEVDLATLEISKDIDLTLEMKDSDGNMAGALSLRLRREEQLVLPEADYDGLVSTLETFTNDVTLDMYTRTPVQSSELANVLLNIFQAHGTAEAWLRHLVHDEIYNTRRHIRKGSKTTVTSDRDPAFSNTENNESGSDRTNEALLLFRANTLLTRALDSFMRRTGQSYLEMTLRVKLQDIADAEEECEVDPSRLEDDEDHSANWQRLIANTKEVWSFIRYSTFNCPMELRRIFRTIRDLAHHRFGTVMPSKVYTSVSSFLFLRFFCAAILNPRLFGLIKAEPGPNAQRTFMLIAKSLQGLANMSTFGNKEHWMAPMNSFCTANRIQFEMFINDICDVEIQEPGQAEQLQPPTEAQASRGALESRNELERNRISSEGRLELRPSSRNSRTDTPMPQLRSPTALRSSFEEPQARSGSSYTHTQSQSQADPMRPSSKNSYDPVAQPPAGVVAASRLADSEPTSPEDFNTADSLAYSNSFAVEPPSPDSDSFSLAEPDEASSIMARRFRANELSPNLSPIPRNAGSRMSVASQNTVIYVGSDRAGSASPLKGSDTRASSRASMASRMSRLYISDDASIMEEAGDESSIYESAVASPEIESFDVQSFSSEAIEDAPPPSISRLRARVSGSSGRTNSTELSRPSSAQTAVTTPSTVHSATSLKSKASLDLPLQDPLRMVLDRLPNREGLLTLPGLIDPAKNLAVLVNLWLDSVEVRLHRAAAAAAAGDVHDGHAVEPIAKELSDPDSKLAQLHRLCLELRDRADQYRTRALEEAARESNRIGEDEGGITAHNITVKWTTVAERIEASPHLFWTFRSGRPMSQGSRTSSAYPATVTSAGYARSSMSTHSRESIDTVQTVSTIGSAAPPPPAISRDPRDPRDRKKNTKTAGGIAFGPARRYPEDPPPSQKSKIPWGRLTSSGTASAMSSSRHSARSEDSLGSSGSEKTVGTIGTAGTGNESKSSTKSGSREKNKRKKSPQRTAEQNAMRKIGFI